MAQGKYGKNLKEAYFEPSIHPPGQPIVRFDGVKHGFNTSFMLVPVTQPVLMLTEPHKHDFQQLLCFIGSDPQDLSNFGAEIELFLGEEGEKHVITSPTIVDISPGLIHGPLNYKRVDKTVFHLDIFFAPDYKRIGVTR